MCEEEGHGRSATASCHSIRGSQRLGLPAWVRGAFDAPTARLRLLKFPPVKLSHWKSSEGKVPPATQRGKKMTFLVWNLGAFYADALTAVNKGKSALLIIPTGDSSVELHNSWGGFGDFFFFFTACPHGNHVYFSKNVS